MLLAPLLAPLAHTGLTLAESWTTPELPITVGVILIMALYLYAVGPLREHYGWADRVAPKQVVYFLLAMVLAFVSLQGPLHVLSDGYLLTAHMTQHLLITLIMPPLLLKGLPSWLVDRLLLLPLYARRAIRQRRPGALVDRLPRGPLLHRLGRVITSPFVAYPAFNIVLLVWHAPAFYDMTLTNDTIHSMMHSMFIVTAVLTWWPVYSPTSQLPALSDPLQMFYLFAQSVPSTILGAIITFANAILYPTYAAAPRVWLSAQDDQQVAGMLMWFGGGGLILGLLTIRWFRWIGLDDGSADPAAELRPELRQPTNAGNHH